MAAALPAVAGSCCCICCFAVFCWLLIEDILMMKIGLAPRNSMPLSAGSSLKRSMPSFSSNLLSLLPSVGGLEGIRVE